MFAALVEAERSAGRQRRSDAQLGRARGEHLPHGVVELSQAGEPRGERHVDHRDRRRLDQDSGILRPLRAGQCQRSCAELGQQESIEVTVAVPQAPGQRRNTLTIDHSVRDQSHGPCHDVGPTVPLRRAGRRVGTAPLAGAVARQLRSGRRREELDIGRLGSTRRTAGSAVDAGRADRRHETPVETGVPTLDDSVAAVVVVEHDPIIVRSDDGRQRFSDVATRRSQDRAR